MIIFSKPLSKTDVERRCAVPKEFFKMECFPKPTSRLEGNHQDFVVKDESGRDWTLCCSIRNIGKYPKPVLTKEWIQFVRNKRLRKGDRVIIYEEQDDTGLMQRRIKVDKSTSTSEARCSPIMNQNLDGNNGSGSHNNANESTATIQPFKDHLAGVLNHDLGGTTAPTISSIDKVQDIASHMTKRPRLNLTLATTMRGGMTAATSYSINKQPPTSHSTPQDIEMPSLSLNLGFPRYSAHSKLEFGIDSTPTIRGGQQHDYIQETEPKTIDFLGRFV